MQLQVVFVNQRIWLARISFINRRILWTNSCCRQQRALPTWEFCVRSHLMTSSRPNCHKYCVYSENQPFSDARALWTNDFDYQALLTRVLCEPRNLMITNTSTRRSNKFDILEYAFPHYCSLNQQIWYLQIGLAVTRTRRTNIFHC